MGTAVLTPPSSLRLRLRLRDLGACAAFASMALSGQLPLAALGVCVLGLAVALAGRRPLAARVGLSAVLLAGVGLLLGYAVVRGAMDPIVAACSFAALLNTQRLLTAPSAATDGQVFLTGLLMVAGGAALSGDLLYAPALLLFSVFSCLSLGLGVVEAATPPGEPVPVRGVLRPLGAALAVALVGGLAFFVLFPRLSWNVASRRVSPGLAGASTGFSDTVRLGGTGTLKTSTRPVLRARLQPDPGVERLDGYWVGRTYESFDGRQWHESPKVLRTAPLVYMRETGAPLVHQQLEVLPAYGSQTLVALDTPVQLGNAVGQGLQGNRPVQVSLYRGGEVRFAQPAVGYTYHAYSAVQGKPAGAGQARAGVDGSADAYLKLPAQLDARVPELAERVLAGEAEPLAAARKLAAHLKREYRYTLELPGEVEDPLADFLFSRREGHCEHFATALTVLLRSRGIPARVASGFFGGERVEGQYVVRAGDAHAWTQVLVPGRGWVTVDATPDAYRTSQPNALLAWLSHGYEVVDAFWRNRVVDYSFRDQLDFVRTLTRPTRERTPAGGDAAPPSRLRLPPAKAWGAALLVALATWAAVHLLGRRGPPSGKAHPASALLDGAEHALRRARLERPAGEGLEELAARLAAAAHPLAPPLTRLTRRYLEARFGAQALGPGEGKALVRSLADAVQAHARALEAAGAAEAAAARASAAAQAASARRPGPGA
jgi:transglutaminase-like putative cysteine protease